jgi:hypothetical protein
MKLHAVGLRGTAHLMPSELSGGMARRVALARAIALDPMLVMYDEPFAGLDPISLGVVGQMIRRLNDALGITSVVVTHDVYESLKIVDYMYFVSEGRIIAQGTPADVRGSADPFVRQFVDGAPDGPVPFHYPAPTVPLGALCRCLALPPTASPTRCDAWAGRRSRRSRDSATPRASPSPWCAKALRRFARLHLTVREIYFAGVLSLVIIAVSGMFVGMVLALQGYDVLERYGADESLGVLVALSLVRELGPVVAGLLFASRAGSAITAEIGLMKATEQLSAMEMMAVDPLARVVAPRFWGGVISMPLLAALFSMMGVFGAYLVGVRLIDIDRRRVLGKHEGSRRFPLRHRQWRHQERRVRLRRQHDRRVRGVRSRARRPRGCRARRRAPSSRARLRSSRSISSSPSSCSGGSRERERRMNVGRGTLDLWVGIFVAIGIGAILFLALKVGNLVTFGSTEGYRLEARFDNIGGSRCARRPRPRVSSSAASSASNSIRRPTRRSSRSRSTTRTSSRRTRSRRSSRRASSARSISASIPEGTPRCCPTEAGSRRRNRRWCSKS